MPWTQVQRCSVCVGSVQQDAVASRVEGRGSRGMVRGAWMRDVVYVVELSVPTLPGITQRRRAAKPTVPTHVSRACQAVHVGPERLYTQLTSRSWFPVARNSPRCPVNFASALHRTHTAYQATARQKQKRPRCASELQACDSGSLARCLPALYGYGHGHGHQWLLPQAATSLVRSRFRRP